MHRAHCCRLWTVYLRRDYKVPQWDCGSCAKWEYKELKRGNWAWTFFEGGTISDHLAKFRKYNLMTYRNQLEKNKFYKLGNKILK